MNADIQSYNISLSVTENAICDYLAEIISSHLPEAESKIWHRHPVWFIDGNPIVGYSSLKNGIRLLFWSGQSFDDNKLQKEGSFKAAEIRFSSLDQINEIDIIQWLMLARDLQWDYKNLIKRKGKLERLK